MDRLAIAAISFVALGACAMSEAPDAGPGLIASDMDHLTGTATMATDGTLTITFVPQRPPLILRPDDPDERRRAVYHDYVQFAGGLRPGESKPLYSYYGWVHMNADRSLTVAWQGDSSPPIVEPRTETINPGEPRYDDIVALVGGLTPGQGKGIPWPR